MPGHGVAFKAETKHSRLPCYDWQVPIHPAASAIHRCQSPIRHGCAATCMLSSVIGVYLIDLAAGSQATPKPCPSCTMIARSHGPSPYLPTKCRSHLGPNMSALQGASHAGQIGLDHDPGTSQSWALYADSLLQGLTQACGMQHLDCCIG